MKTAVLYNIFNRPDLTKQSFAAIRQARPPRLYIAADGPRPGRAGEEDACHKAREIVAHVDWPCEVKTLFRKKNLGCKLACSSAITWFFRQESEGIILEDDCVPHPDFFPYCEELLERYRNTPEVMVISGSNFDFGKKRGSASYYFSIFPHIWGWASWGSTWSKYDVCMEGVTSYIHRYMADKLQHDGAFRIMARKFYLVSEGYDDTWDYQLVYTVWKYNGLCIIPNTNLVQNIGFVENSAHPAPPDIRMNRQTAPLGALKHPEGIQLDADAQLFACEMLANEQGGYLDALLQEGVGRLHANEYEVCQELVQMLKEFFGSLHDIVSLELALLLAQGEQYTFRQKYAELKALYPGSPLIQELEKVL